jgi:1-deoxy-D-xylulose-5-phosphate reductoisomerase
MTHSAEVAAWIRPSIPPATSHSVPASASPKAFTRVESAITASLAPVRRAASASASTLVCAVKATTSNRSGDRSIRSSVERPMEPVAPRIAIFQCLAGSRSDDVARLVLTASGGPFREFSVEQMRRATPAQAVAHPKWSMGAKISVDSATLMNKGLEVIEAHHLFGLESERIDIVVHPQSVVHSLVEFVDGSLLAQLGSADMRIPIAYTLAWPERMETPAERLSLTDIARLDFETPDSGRFPALRLAREALASGEGAPVVLNAANEVAVAAFLDGEIGFCDICRIVERAVDRIETDSPASVDDVIAIDSETRQRARAFLTETCP